jgi:hypothetical protein
LAAMAVLLALLGMMEFAGYARRRRGDDRFA